LSATVFFQSSSELATLTNTFKVVSLADGTTTISLDITAAGFNQVTFVPPLDFAVSQTVTVTLAAPGGAVVGKLLVNAYVEN